LTPHPSAANLLTVQALPWACPPLPDLPPFFWDEVAKNIAYWQDVLAQRNPDDPPLTTMRKQCIARIKTRLRRIEAGRNAGRSLFEISHYIACLTVIDSRN
jgi:hypothetical protein